MIQESGFYILSVCMHFVSLHFKVQIKINVQRSANLISACRTCLPKREMLNLLNYRWFKGKLRDGGSMKGRGGGEIRRREWGKLVCVW